MAYLQAARLYTMTDTHSTAHRNGNIYAPQQWQQLEMVTAPISYSRSLHKMVVTVLSWQWQHLHYDSNNCNYKIAAVIYTIVVLFILQW